MAFIDPFLDAHAVYWTVALFGSFLLMLMLFSAGGPCKHKSGQAAHHLTMVIPFAYLSIMGMRLWPQVTGMVADSAHARMFFQVDAMQFYAPTMLGLQVFDLSTTIILPGMRKPDAIAHHAVSLYLAYQLTSNGFLHYWEPFYFGLLELSSVPLCFVDFFRAFPALSKRFDAVNEVVRLSFAATFIPVRCLYMPYISYFWWRDFLSCARERARRDTRVCERGRPRGAHDLASLPACPCRTGCTLPRTRH